GSSSQDAAQRERDLFHILDRGAPSSLLVPPPPQSGTKLWHPSLQAGLRHRLPIGTTSAWANHVPTGPGTWHPGSSLPVRAAQSRSQDGVLALDVSWDYEQDHRTSSL